MTLKSRLDQITTVPGEKPTRRVLRYHLAIRNRLREHGPPEAVDEVYSDIVAKILEGKFDTWDPSKGKFHHFLAASIDHAVADFFRRRQRRHEVPLPDTMASRDTVDAEFGQEVIHEVLRQLSRYQRMRNLGRKTGGRWGPNAYFTILRLRMKHPDLSIEELIARLPWRLQKWFRSKPAAFSKQLQHARELFAALLVVEVAAPYQDMHPELPANIGPALVQAVGRTLQNQEWLKELMRDLKLWHLVRDLCPDARKRRRRKP